MKKSAIVLSIVLGLNLGAAPIEDMMALYKQKQYKNACNLGLRYFHENSTNANYIMLYALSCLKGDYIDRLAVPITALRYNPTQRKNAAYFANILFQKKLLYHALIDNVDIQGIVLPRADHPVSIVFTLIAKGLYQKSGNVYYMKDPQKPGMSYRVYVQRNRTPHLVVEEYLDDRLIKEHRYW